MKTIKEIYHLSLNFLQERNVTNPRRVIEELIKHIFDLSRLDLYMSFDKPIEEKELQLLRSLLKRAATHEPYEYITGKLKFLDLELFISADCLIPRSETEILAEMITKELDDCPVQLWDICCGSGCLGLAIKNKLPNVEVTLSDISKNALELAQKNAKHNQLDIAIAHGDLLAPFAEKKADVIVCNPPYISAEEYETLDRSVRSFEPKQALLAGSNGLEFYSRLAKELPAYLNRGAKLFFEIGCNQAEAVKKIFSEPHWKSQTISCDWAGHPRFFFLEIE